MKQMRHRSSTGVALLIVVLLLVLLWPLEDSIERKTGKAPIELPAVGQMGGVFQFFQIVGFNALLADLLWMKADDLWHSNSWWEMAPVMESIVRIDPSYTLVWRVLAWHYGWNLHAASPSQLERSFWLEKAADTYRRALAANQEDAGLWEDVCWFYEDRVRQYDKAEGFLKQAVERFPTLIDTLERRLQRVYERTWRIDDAIAVIEDILRKNPQDTLAKRDARRWSTYGKDVNLRWILEERENLIRATRGLPPYQNPYEGTLVESPPWRDWSAPYYRDPNWLPDITRFNLTTVLAVVQDNSALREQYQKAHPNVRIPEPGETAIPHQKRFR